MSAAPRVSVYLPTRDRAHRVEGAVRSVLAQTVRDLELIVVDDGSIDSTPPLLARLAAEDARIRVLRNEQPQGAAAARNRAIDVARGEFITGLDDDDRMRPERLQVLLDAWQDRYAFVCSAFWLAGCGACRPVGTSIAEITLDALLHRNVVGNQVLTRTERVNAVGGFDASFVASQDYDLWTRLVARYGVGLRVPVATCVVHREASAPSITHSPRALEGARQYLAKHRDLMGPAHLRSQALVLLATAGRRATLRDLLTCGSGATAASLLAYWARTNVPGVEGLGRAWTRWRWPERDLPA